MLVLMMSVVMVQGEESAADLLKQSMLAAKSGKQREALDLVNQAILLDAKNPRAHFWRGQLHESERKHELAVADFAKAIDLDKSFAEAYDRRGSELFKLGKIRESVADFDAFLERRPAQKPWHWKRGISLYYLGRFEDGKAQFEGYQTVDDNDVENAVWRYLCMARGQSVEKARADILKIGKDTRVPMAEIYQLFAGKLMPEAILPATEQGKPTPGQLNDRRFYAHLYLGLYHEVHGEAGKAKEHLAKAVKHKIGHYMWDVARVHLELLDKKAQ
jgi:lipoprotein NlpI